MKWAYTFAILGVVLVWSVFCVWVTWKAVELRTTVDIISAAGANVVLGVLLSMLKDVNQFWFRKHYTEEGGK